MTFSSVPRSVARSYDHGRSPNSVLLQRLLGAGFALACTWVLWNNLAGVVLNANDPNAAAVNTPRAPTVVQKGAKLPSLANAYVRLAAAMRGAGQTVSANDYGSLLEPHAWLSAAESFSIEAGAEAVGRAPGLGRFTIEAAREVSSTVKSANRLVEKSAGRLVEKVATAALQPRAPQNRMAAIASEPGAPPERPGIFEKLFGKPAPMTLAYAATDEGALDGARGSLAGPYDRETAVYDISAHTVYMPDGTRLEAHSGLGAFLDDPRHVDQRNRGATPPDVYDLTLREGLFHGVQAIRLVPVDESRVFGRSGLLAHTYMYGPNGASFGCVSFRNYDAFLQAYLNHKIRRLVVVAGPV